MQERATAERLAVLSGPVGEQPDKRDLMPVYIELACGQKKLGPEWIGIDVDPVCLKLPGRNLVHDLFEYPWPFEDGVADEVFASHFFEHIPGKIHLATGDGLSYVVVRPRLQFMAEVWRICKPGALVVLQVPYGKNVRAMQDHDHAWPPIVEETFLYFDRDWLKANRLDHGPYASHYAHFKLEKTQRVHNPRMAGLHPEAVRSQSKTDWDSVDDIIVTLRCIKEGPVAAKPAAVPKADPVPEQAEEQKEGPV